MTIETKFDIASEVYFLLNDKVIKDEVVSILIVVDKKYLDSENIATYFLKSNGVKLDSFPMFKTKEELLASL